MIFRTKEIIIGRAATGADLTAYPMDRVSYAVDNYDPAFMKVPVIPDHNEFLSSQAHADETKCLGHAWKMRYDADLKRKYLDVWSSYELTPQCVQDIRNGEFTGISYSINYLTKDPYTKEEMPASFDRLPDEWKTFFAGFKRGRLLFDYFDHHAFLKGKQQNHTRIGHPEDLLDGEVNANINANCGGNKGKCKARGVWTAPTVDFPDMFTPPKMERVMVDFNDIREATIKYVNELYPSLSTNITAKIVRANISDNIYKIVDISGINLNAFIDEKREQINAWIDKSLSELSHEAETDDYDTLLITQNQIKSMVAKIKETRCI